MLVLKDAKDENQIIEDKKNAFTKTIFTPARDIDFPINMRDPLIWKNFPLKERFFYHLFCHSDCVQDHKDYLINQVLNYKCTINSKINLENKCLSLTIIQSGSLAIKPIIMHPYVKITICNLRTGKYLQKAKFEDSCFVKNETNLIINNDRNENRIHYRESALDFIPPFSTAPFDMRERGESFAFWNEEIIINDEASNIFQSDNIIFFEVIDFNFAQPEAGFNYPIAWGYIKPVGYSQTYFGKFKVQLYEYKYRETEKTKYDKTNNLTYLRTPQVLLEFNWIKKQKYQTYLEIDMKLLEKPKIVNEKLVNTNGDAKIQLERFKNTAFFYEGMDTEVVDKEDLKQLIENQRKNKLQYDELDQKANEKRRILLKRRKNPSENSILPDKLLFKFNTAKLGCLTIAFSNNGKYLAAACTEIDSLTTIKVFNVEDGIIKYHFKGHQQIIHHLLFSNDDNVLISSSADNNLSFWHIPKEESNNIENLNYRDNEKYFKIFSINHASYVYSCSIMPESTRELMIIATACFDGNIRIFDVEFNYDYKDQKYIMRNYNTRITISINEEYSNSDFKNKLDLKTSKNDELKEFKDDPEKKSLLNKTVFEHRHPNCLTFDETGRLYIGDSLGIIHIYDTKIAESRIICNKVTSIVHKELNGDCINNIILDPNNRRRLIVHSRDNCLRLIDLSQDRARPIIRYFSSKCNKTNIKSSLSVDGEYLLAGSEDGKPYLWSATSGIEIPTDKFECQFSDAVSDVCWNKRYNMIALCGFGQEYPLLVYVHEKEEIVIDNTELKLKNIDKLVNNEESKNNMGNNDTNENRRRSPNKVLTSLQNNISNYATEYKMIIEDRLNEDNQN